MKSLVAFAILLTTWALMGLALVIHTAPRDAPHAARLPAYHGGER